MDSYQVQHRIHLKPGREASVAARHPWVFSGAVERVESLAGAVDGGVCDLLDAEGGFRARGTLHRSSQILCRILTWKEEPIDDAFFASRIAAAAALRERWIDAETTDAYRLVNAEGDLLPGLIVDRYADHLAVQCLTSGMSHLEALWCGALDRLLSPAAIIDRTERAVRDPALEGRCRALRGGIPEGAIPIKENGLAFRVRLDAGQKTGFYIDQRENRALLGRLARGCEVLNGFSYTGAFGVYAACGGAARVVQVESSAPALEEARAHWQQNGLSDDRVEHVKDDLFRFLRREERMFDIVVLDPPPYAKQKADVARAARAYKDLNLWGMRRLRPGGLLMSFSCSQHISVDLFQKILFGATRDAGVSLQWLKRLGPGADHPVHVDHPQGEYLKGFLLRRLDAGG